MEDLGYAFGDQPTAARLATEVWPTREFGPLVEYCRSAEAFQDAPFSFPDTFQAMDVAFPGSKFVLTVRSSPEEWHRSMIRAHGAMYGDGRIPPTPEDLQQADSWLYRGRPWEMNRLLFDSPDDDPYEQSALVEFYEHHVYAVTHYFRYRPDDLLVLNVADDDAADRLARFLGRTPTGRPFPHLNAS